MATRSAHRRQEFSFAGDEGADDERRRAMLPPRLPELAANPMAPRAGEEEFRWLQESRLGSPESAVLSGSGTPSPRLWTHLDDDRRLYPASAGSSPPGPSRAQAIAGYRREMLDLVRGLPEAAYELSLRDIVEHRSSPPLPPLPPPPPAVAVAGEEELGSRKQGATTAATTTTVATTVAAAMADDEEDYEEQRKQSIGGKKQGKQGRKKMGRARSRSMERSVSLDTGLLIKLFMPLSVGGGGRTKKKKVSPSPKPVADKDGLKKKKKQGRKKRKEGEEEEWWKKSEFSSEAGSSSRTSSSGSSNSNGSAIGIPAGAAGGTTKAPAKTMIRKRLGCYGFFRSDKSKNGAIQE
ncbi:uncharacterized protein LOC100845221 [Brachypodium distachyon]|uniref:Uncharacterized protein n=1 Tax=Brachypodium distachyon TaxID=15368 RepID=I1IMQ9_BRADI|nr:uncharacterized protein LOC100845221 [Brachypodium distachyon]KQJ89035.1 hypothetical protein BRADI_4g23107v3 [Brachypodium distachyon]|eukprot:XP_003576201.1 uncharacterized protein LOC100845221 [Brachypodium distachyon]